MGDTFATGPAYADGVPLLTQVVYGSGDWSLSSFNTFRQIFYAIFLTDVVGLDPRLASFAALTGVIWDALNDPVMGTISDRTRTRWGRRRPFLLWFSVPFGLTLVLLWWAPPWESQAALALHVTLAYILSDTLQTVVSVPFYALTPEITPDYDERTSLTAWRMFFNTKQVQSIKNGYQPALTVRVSIQSPARSGRRSSSPLRAYRLTPRAAPLCQLPAGRYRPDLPMLPGRGYQCQRQPGSLWAPTAPTYDGRRRNSDHPGCDRLW